MQIRTLVLLTLLLSVRGNSQVVFGPVGTSWNYVVTGQTHSGDLSLHYQKDTLITGLPLKKITRAFYYTCICPQGPVIGSDCCEYYLERNDSVLRYQNNSLQLLYSFNNQPGDTIYYNSLNLKLSLDSISQRSICSLNRRVLHYTRHYNSCTDTLTIIEGIGPVNDYLTPTVPDQCFVDGTIIRFKCANLISCNYPSNTCATLPYSVKENDLLFSFQIQNKQKILKVRFSQIFSGQIEIFDLSGKQRIQINVIDTESAVLNCTSFESGLYLVRIKTNKAFFSKRIIIED